MSVKPALYYFNGKGRAEHIRLIFAAAGKEYDDKRLTAEEWAELKPKTPFGALPVLVFPDGKMIGHSGCIARAVAHECGLVGKDKKETVLADMVAETIIEIREGSLAPLFLEKDEAKKKEMEQKFATETLPKFLTALNAILADKQYFTGDQMTFGDIYFFTMVDEIDKHVAAVIDKFPKLRALEKRVRENPGIAKYLKDRPVTPF